MQKIDSTATTFRGQNTHIATSTATTTHNLNPNLRGAGSSTSPGITPIKTLPFSPSQFLNSPCPLSFDMLLPASTPVRKHLQKVNLIDGEHCVETSVQFIRTIDFTRSVRSANNSWTLTIP